MNANIDMIRSATDKRYTDFSVSVKSTLHSKLSNQEDIKSYTNQIDKIQSYKDTFVAINTPEE